jgi:hypothetical protein
MDYLLNKLDFDIGKAFEHDVHCKTGRLIHSHSRFEKGFYLLATFRRYLFQLNEESVALALQSFLGGLAKSFRVSYESHNHFRFTVSCKAVGFAIYNLRRFIGTSFDVYFHLWSNGAPHWELKKGFGRQKKLSNGLRFSQRIKRDWHLSLLLLPRSSGNEFALLKVLCKPRQLSNRSLLVILSLLKLAIWTSSFLALTQKFYRLVAFLRNLLMMFHRVSSKVIRLLMNMRRFKGFQPDSVFKALIFPKLLIHLFLLRLIPSLEKLIVLGAWGVVSLS